MSKSSFASIIKKQKAAMDKEAHAAHLTAGQDVKDKHDRVVQRWKHKPVFKVQRLWVGTLDTILIVPSGKHKAIWYYVDLGTKPHTIKAKNAPKLTFQTGYSARTAPVARSAVGTGKASGAWVQVAEVHHPGNEARLFSETILDDLIPPLVDRIQDALSKGIRKVR